jgi:hypothetical protein
MDSDLTVIIKNLSLETVEGNPNRLTKLIEEMCGEDAIISFNSIESDDKDSRSAILKLKRKEDGLGKIFYLK